MITYFLAGRLTRLPVHTVHIGYWRFTDGTHRVELHTFGWNAYYGRIANDQNRR